MFTVCADSDSGVHCFGENHFGENLVPDGVKDVSSLSVGAGHVCAVVKNKVRCWGRNNYHQSEVPVDLGDVESVTAGAFDSCALTKSRKVACWGQSSKAYPIPDDLGDSYQVTTHSGVSCGLTGEGLRCWGAKGNPNDVWNPGDIPPEMLRPSYITGGDSHICFPVGKGIRCAEYWYDTTYSQVTYGAGAQVIGVQNPRGYQGKVDQVTKWMLPGYQAPLDPLAISSKGDLVCASYSNGARCWEMMIEVDSARYGKRLPTQEQLLPSTLQGASQLAIATGQPFAGAYEVFGLVKGRIFCEGNYPDDVRAVPNDLRDPTQVASASGPAMCAVTKDGVRCWGVNSAGVLMIPKNLNNPVRLASVNGGICAFNADNTVNCWGNVPKIFQSLPEGVLDVSGSCFLTKEKAVCEKRYGDTMEVPLVSATQLVSGSTYSCAITAKGIRCWGEYPQRMQTYNGLSYW
jgi:hypothetical protein